jgi:hypothetical protein
VDDLIAFVHSVEDAFDGATNVDNTFALDGALAAQQMEYRTFTMHVVWPPKQGGGMRINMLKE